MPTVWKRNNVEVRTGRDQYGRQVWRVWENGKRTKQYGMSKEKGIELAQGRIAAGGAPPPASARPNAGLPSKARVLEWLRTRLRDDILEVVKEIEDHGENDLGLSWSGTKAHLVGQLETRRTTRQDILEAIFKVCKGTKQELLDEMRGRSSDERPLSNAGAQRPQPNVGLPSKARVLEWLRTRLRDDILEVVKEIEDHGENDIGLKWSGTKAQLVDQLRSRKPSRQDILDAIFQVFDGSQQELLAEMRGSPAAAPPTPPTPRPTPKPTPKPKPWPKPNLDQGGTSFKVPRDAFVGKVRVLVIGNEEYSAETTLSNPVLDALTLHKRMKDLGHHVAAPVINATRAEMERRLSGFHRSLKKDEGAFVYYSGHGLEFEGTNYILPVDFDCDEDFQIKYQGVSLNLLLDAVKKARFRFIVLDSCRSAPRKVRGSVAWGFRGVGSPPAGDTLIWYATKPGDDANDGDAGELSPFARALVGALGDKSATHIQVFRKVAMAVKRATGNGQKPWYEGDFDVDWYPGMTS